MISTEVEGGAARGKDLSLALSVDFHFTVFFFESLMFLCPPKYYGHSLVEVIQAFESNGMNVLIYTQVFIFTW